MEGTKIDNGASPRMLVHNGDELAAGGRVNNAGLYAVGSKLYLDGGEIADSVGDTGLIDTGTALKFNGVEIGQGTPTPPTPPSPESGLWLPPMQDASSYNKFTYRTFIDAYDALMKSSGYPGTIKKYEYREQQTGTRVIRDTQTSTPHTVPTWGGSFVEVAADAYNDNDGVGLSGYPLYHYEFTPNGGYTKTFYVQACIHGNEHDAPQTLLRIIDIICNHTNEAAYARLKPLRDNVRWIILPVVSPVGHDGASMNVKYYDWDGNLKEGTSCMNMNRNMDCNQVYPLAGVGSGGNYPIQTPENRHTEHIIRTIGPHNIDYAVDCHDGGDVNKHFWFNYNADGANNFAMNKLLDDLISHEEELRLAGGTDYRRFSGGDDESDELGYIHPNVKDCFGYSTGTNAAYYNGTLGMLGSVSEYIGGIFGYGFTAEQMTRSLRIRANILIYAYELINTKGWLVNESAEDKWFHFNYPVSMCRFGLQVDIPGSDPNCHHVVTQSDVYDRWDRLAANYPMYVSKSESLGTNQGGTNIYSYTLGSGPKKVLFIGGSMRWDKKHKETEFGIYLVAEYLCNDYIVNQSRFLQRLKRDYTIVVLPCIDINAGGNVDGIRELGLNAAGLTTNAKWRLSNGKCVPTAYATGTAKDVPIFMSWLSQHQDALLLLSG
jgi:hypothetical protein